MSFSDSNRRTGVGPAIFVLGSANMDLVIAVDHLPRAGETLAGGDLALFPGGKGANQAYAAATLGGRVSIVAAVGSDPFGPKLLSSLADAGVDTRLVEISEAPTGCACIYVLPDGDNSIVISPGANATLTPEKALAKLQGMREGDFLLAQLETPLNAVEAAFAYARTLGVTTILDPAPARPLPASLLENVDILTPNQTEAGVLLGNPELCIDSFADAERTAVELLALGPQAVVLKLGALGCLFADASEQIGARGFTVKAVDTTAAGDVFNAALAVAMAEGFSLPRALRFANAAAAVSVTRPGAQNSAPTRREAEAMQSDNPLR